MEEWEEAPHPEGRLAGRDLGWRPPEENGRRDGRFNPDSAPFPGQVGWRGRG